mmetsp:Transcript_17190/g.37296  ORF Transcript_17190/g.37296 Transcript_17190/m.37296 type:complete len:322 (-) Transcript_17190:434-1399(-)
MVKINRTPFILIFGIFLGAFGTITTLLFLKVNYNQLGIGEQREPSSLRQSQSISLDAPNHNPPPNNKAPSASEKNARDKRASPTEEHGTANKQQSDGDDDGDNNLPWYEKKRPLLREFPPIVRRLEFLHHLDKVKFKTAIEVGVQKGILAKKSLDIWKSCTEYKLVDLWGKEEGYVEPGPDDAAAKNAYLNEARNRMKKWPESKVKFFVMRSTDASKFMEDDYFDYVYLDARHDYCAVKEDIEHYWPKVRPGGILAGHDYIDAQYAIDKLGDAGDWSVCEDGSNHPGAVKGAVDEFRQKEGGLYVYTSNEDFPSWYVQKPY